MLFPLEIILGAVKHHGEDTHILYVRSWFKSYFLL